MKADIKVTHLDELIRKRDTYFFKISSILIIIFSVIFIISRYYTIMLRAYTYDMFHDISITKMDPNDILAHSGFGLIIFIAICIAVIFYNRYILNKNSKSSYLLKRIPQKSYYYKTITRYPVKWIIGSIIVAVILEAVFIFCTLHNGRVFLDNNISVDYIRILF